MSETRAAAERLRRCGDGENPYKVYCPKKFGGRWTQDDECAFRVQTRADFETLARAYLAEHPADDGEAVDEAWLLAIGGVKGWHPDKITFDRNDALSVGLWNVSDGWKAMLLLAEHSAVCIVRGLRTRGDVRRLCAALGIELKEAT